MTTAVRDRRLEGKIALITGTAGGQGREAAKLFAAEGAKIVGCDLKAEEASQTVEMVRSAGGEMVSQAPVNLAEEQDVVRWIDFAVRSYGDFDILYNNASAPRFAPVHEMSREDWDFTLANELTLIFLTVKHAYPVFRRKQAGVIINTGSVAGILGAGALPRNGAGALAHAVTKAGVVAMTRVLACELSPFNVRVNCISPGLIESPATADLVANEAFREGIIAAQLIPRVGRTLDIAHAALFLASEEASFINGAHLIVDGGQYASGGVGRPGEFSIRRAGGD
jgi:meso-butanediol dehydrogenase / (S,S)-butanediol dehydrogenase / diacetyl reductase